MSFADDAAYCIQNTRVLIYNGQDDFLINSMGAERWVSHLDIPEIQKW